MQSSGEVAQMNLLDLRRDIDLCLISFCVSVQPSKFIWNLEVKVSFFGIIRYHVSRPLFEWGRQFGSLGGAMTNAGTNLAGHL